MARARTGRSWIAGVTLLLVLVGCTPAPPQPTPHATPRPSATAVADDGRIAAEQYVHLANARSRLELVEPDVGISAPWVVIQKASASAVLFIAYPARIPDGPDCGHAVGVAVEEADDAVTIAVRSTRPTASTGCTTAPRIDGGWIELHAVIGTRTLIHAPVDAPWRDAPPPIETRAEPTAAPAPALAPDYAGPATCDSLLSAATRARLDAQHFRDDGAAFRDKVKQEPSLVQLHAVLEYGGLVCRRIRPDGKGSTSFAWSPITADQAAAQQSALAPTTTSTTVGGVVRCATSDATAQYAFGDGWWVLSYDNGAGSVLDDLVANHP